MLPIQELNADEKIELNTEHLTLCKTYPVSSYLPSVIAENIVYYWTPLNKLCATSYVHKAQLLPRSVNHLFAIPLQHSKIQSMQQEEQMFIEQSKEWLHSKHRRILDQLDVRNGFTKYILVYVSSNRINNMIDQSVQLYQPYACEVHSCILPTAVSLYTLELELAQTTLGGERFAFKSQSRFVRHHKLKMYSSIQTNSIIKRLYEKSKKKIEKELHKHKDSKAYKDALDVVVDQQYKKHKKTIKKELTKGQWDPKKRFRTKNELRQIMLYYMKKQAANKAKKPSTQELEQQITKLNVEDRPKSRQTRHRRKSSASRNQIVIM